MKKCPKCGVEMEDSAEVCSVCNYSFLEAAAETTAPVVSEAPETGAENTFDHKPLVMEWYTSSGFAKFLFNVWPKISLISLLVSIVCNLAGLVFLCLGLLNNIPGVEKIIPDGLGVGLGISALSFALGLRAVLTAANLVFRNDLKKILFSGFLKKKGVDLDEATKYVFKYISMQDFSFLNGKEKGDIASWLANPKYFGEAVMMASKPATKRTNLIWMCVLAGVSFVCEWIINSALLTLLGGLFGFDFNNPQLGSLLLSFVIFIVLLLVGTIANAIVSSIGNKKKVEAKAVWAAEVNNPDKKVEVVIA